jgi:hypothetical protein
MHEPKDEPQSSKGGATGRSLSLNSGTNCRRSIGSRSVSFWR